MGLIVHNTSTPDSGLGDALRTGFVNQNLMNAELYNTAVFKVAGYDLSKNDFTDILLAKLNAIDATATPNIKSDWNEIDPTSDAYILNKPLFDTGEILVSAIWTSGLSFNVTADAFPINGTTFPANPATVTLDAADATLDRIDLIVAIKPVSPLTVGEVGFISGTPATTALVVPPDYDRSIYYVIKQITVRAAATAPENTSTTQIYNEGTEWAFTLTPNIAQTTNDPSVGVNCLEATETTNTDRILFTAPALLSTGAVSLLTFDFKLKEEAFNRFIYVEFLLAGVRILNYSFTSGQNGYDAGNLSYQTISIDKAALNLNLENFDEIRIRPFFASLGYYFDNFILHTGSGSETLPIGGIPEAPSDGNQYARINEAWAVVTAGAGDMLASVYDPTAVSGDAFSTDNMKEPTTAKTTPIDADTIPLWDSISTSFKKLSWANLKTALANLYVSKTTYNANTILAATTDDTPAAVTVGEGTFIGRIVGGAIAALTISQSKTQLKDRLLENATVTGAYALDYAAYELWNLTLTAAASFTESNLEEKTILIRVTGNFALTLVAAWSTDITGVYDGTVQNIIVVQYFKSGVYKVQITQPS
jgi:hypothetical protein